MKIKTLQKKIIPILRRAGVRRAGLFGSAAKKEMPHHDIDILVELNDTTSLLGFINLKHRLEETLGQKVDLVEYDSIKPALKNGVLKESVSLMG